MKKGLLTIVLLVSAACSGNARWITPQPAVSPTVHETWYWTPVGNGFITTVSGAAVR